MDSSAETRRPLCRTRKTQRDRTGGFLGSTRAPSFNVFNLISLSQGFYLSGLFEKDARERLEARFTSTQPASTIVSWLEEIAAAEQRFKVEKGKDGLVRLQGSKEGRKGQLGIDAGIYEVTPSFSIVEVKKTAGDTLEYMEFRDHDRKPSLKDVVWVWQGNSTHHQVQQPQPL